MLECIRVYIGGNEVRFRFLMRKAGVTPLYVRLERSLDHVAKFVCDTNQHRLTYAWVSELLHLWGSHGVSHLYLEIGRNGGNLLC
jgi:hypothetical protein